jgi:hypothetical protein
MKNNRPAQTAAAATADAEVGYEAEVVRCDRGAEKAAGVRGKRPALQVGLVLASGYGCENIGD